MNGTDLVKATFNAVNNVKSNWTSAHQLHFEDSFQWGPYDPAGTSEWMGTAARATVTISSDGNFVYVDMPVTDEMRTELAGTIELNFLILYDPDLAADEEGDYGPSWTRIWPYLASLGLVLVISIMIFCCCKYCSCCGKKGKEDGVGETAMMRAVPV